VIGLEPTLVGYSLIPDMNAEKVMAALKADQAKLNALGCLTDLGGTAEAVVLQKLSESTFDCTLIGAGVRTVPTHFLLFEKLINVVHQNALKPNSASIQSRVIQRKLCSAGSNSSSQWAPQEGSLQCFAGTDLHKRVTQLVVPRELNLCSRSSVL
jgi:hypothetical protein